MNLNKSDTKRKRSWTTKQILRQEVWWPISSVVHGRYSFTITSQDKTLKSYDVSIFLWTVYLQRKRQIRIVESILLPFWKFGMFVVLYCWEMQVCWTHTLLVDKSCLNRPLLFFKIFIFVEEIVSSALVRNTR